MNVSVVVPAFNAEKYIAETLNSILAQTASPYEIIVVNDASSDNTAKILKSYSKQDLVKVVTHSKNQGIGQTRQTGALKAKGDYVAYLSSDDVWLPTFLETCLPFLNGENAVFANYFRCDSHLSPFTVFKAPEGDFQDNCVKWALQKNMFVNFSSIIVPRSIFENCAFQKDLKHGEDLIFLLDTLLEGLPWICVAKPLLKYRIHRLQGTFVRDINEWLTLWKYLRTRLILLGVEPEMADVAMKKNYALLYPPTSIKSASREVLRSLLNRIHTHKKFLKSIQTYLVHVKSS